jgi:hypothetical protein
MAAPLEMRGVCLLDPPSLRVLAAGYGHRVSWRMSPPLKAVDFGLGKAGTLAPVSGAPQSAAVRLGRDDGS